jgi:hypothetical protein
MKRIGSVQATHKQVHAKLEWKTCDLCYLIALSTTLSEDLVRCQGQLSKRPT